MYQRDKQDPFEERVQTALAKYAEDSSACGSGYDILRYAQQGYIAVSKDVDPQIFIDWYPLHQGYILLRLAKQGKLYYRQNVRSE